MLDLPLRIENLVGLRGKQPSQSVSGFKSQLRLVKTGNVQMKRPDPAKPVGDVFMPAPVKLTAVKAVLNLPGVVEIFQNPSGGVRKFSADPMQPIVSIRGAAFMKCLN
jgi:hypothetical protein